LEARAIGFFGFWGDDHGRRLLVDDESRRRQRFRVPTGGVKRHALKHGDVEMWRLVIVLVGGRRRSP